MRNIETFLSKQMYLYPSLMERKVVVEVLLGLVQLTIVSPLFGEK